MKGNINNCLLLQIIELNNADQDVNEKIKELRNPQLINNQPRNKSFMYFYCLLDREYIKNYCFLLFFL